MYAGDDTLTNEAEKKWHYFPDDILKWISLNKHVRISIQISLKLVSREGATNSIQQLVRQWLGADQATSHYMCHSALMSQ